MKSLFALSIFVLASSSTASMAEEQNLGLGFVEAPASGSTPLGLTDVPKTVMHAAMVALKTEASLTGFESAELDRDEIEAVYELKARMPDGRAIEVDVSTAGVILEIENEILKTTVPSQVILALDAYFPDFKADPKGVQIEKSIRPAGNNLLEVWYEFAGQDFDAEIRSDARVIVIEPA